MLRAYLIIITLYCLSSLRSPPLHDQRIIHPDDMVDYNENRPLLNNVGGSFAGSMLSLITGRQSYSYVHNIGWCHINYENEKILL